MSVVHGRMRCRRRAAGTARAMGTLPVLWLALLPLAGAQVPETVRAEGVRLVGRFVDFEGRPVGDARLTSDETPWAAPVDVRSDAHGRFEVELPWREDGASGWWWRASAVAPGCARRDFALSLYAGMDADVGDVVLEPGASLAFELRGASAEPIERAVAVVERDGGAGVPQGAWTPTPTPGWPWLPAGRRMELTGIDGRFELLGLEPGRCRLWVLASGTGAAASEPVELDVGERANLGVLVVAPLPPGGWLCGVVRDPDGEPVGGVSVSTDVRQVSFVSPDRRVTTDDAGRFALWFAPAPDDLPRVFTIFGSSGPPPAPGTLTLLVRDPADRYLPSRAADVRPGGPPIEIALRARHALELRVTDDAGAPIDHFGWEETWREGERPESRREGRAAHPGGAAELLVHPDLERLVIDSGLHAPAVLGPFGPDGPPARLEVELASLPGVHGRVFHRGEPVTGARVGLAGEWMPEPLDAVVPGLVQLGNESSGDLFVRTGEDGAFRVGLRASEDVVHRLRVWAPGLSEVVTAPVGPGDRIDVHLDGGGDLIGRVWADPGLDPVGLDVFLVRHRDLGMRPPGTVHRARVDESGRFRFTDVPKGPWLVELVVPHVERHMWALSCGGRTDTRFERSAEGLLHVAFVQPGTTSTCDLDLTDGDLCRLDGRLVVDGSPLDGIARLLALDENVALEIDLIEVARDGTFQLAARQPGRYRVVWSEPGQGQLVTDLVELTPGTTLWEPALTRAQLAEPVALDRR